MKKFLVATAAAGALFALSAGAAFAETVVYNSIPTPQPGNVPSEAFEAQSVREFGGQMQLTGN